MTTGQHLYTGISRHLLDSFERRAPLRSAQAPALTLWAQHGIDVDAPPPPLERCHQNEAGDLIGWRQVDVTHQAGKQLSGPPQGPLPAAGCGCGL